MKNSKFGKLNKADFKSLAITVGLAALSAVVAKLIELLPGVDLGSETTMVIVLTLLKILQKVLSGK